MQQLQLVNSDNFPKLQLQTSERVEAKSSPLSVKGDQQTVTSM
jgi:hypothetical protein